VGKTGGFFAKTACTFPDCVAADSFIYYLHLYSSANKNTMARIAGVTTQKDTKGNITHVTINVKKHQQAVPVLQEMGLMEKSQFDKDFERGISIEESRSRTHAYIKNLPWPK
jgi:hypothetical protein